MSSFFCRFCFNSWFFSSSPCPGRLWGPVSFATSLARPWKLTNATMTSGSPRWPGTASSAPSTQSLWPWLWMPAAEEPSSCCPWARWCTRVSVYDDANRKLHSFCLLFETPFFGCLDYFTCKLVFVLVPWASKLHSKIWIPPVEITHAAKEGSLMQTLSLSTRHSLLLLLRSFHHIRS